jgi:cytochrome c
MRLASVALVAGIIAASHAFAAEPDPSRGQEVFRACAPCHSLQPDRSMTGPSLSGVWNRKAGALASFPRYSPALKASGVTWDDAALDAWLRDPPAFIPGNHMVFPGIADDQARSDLLAFLKQATQPGAQTAQAETGMGGMDGMGGMMGNEVPNLKTLPPEAQVTAITYCPDTYRVTTADGQTADFWERNLRFKTDSGDDGPQPGAPAIVGSGMVGDRASVIFASPEELAQAIKRAC